MGLSYLKFKEYVNGREFGNYRKYIPILDSFNEFYEESELKYFYPRNIFNNKPEEFIFFLEEGYVLISFYNDQLEIEHNNCKIIKKTLKYPTNNYGINELALSFDNGKKIILKNLDDSNENWHEEYTSTIRQLYKKL
ncbi:hypothetical protein [Heyndrickxia oleronia]|uniref:hypothetical protein n=1 Tax=Heyndrickxia oleronia TaxID=38875 RepID=UPI003F839C09